MFEIIKKDITDNVIGNENKIEIALASIISGGHILIEDLPGTGKTTFAKAITQALNLDFTRIQFTSDLLPSDIIGYEIVKKNKLQFQKGPIFSNIILADELNRSSPKTQSAFMESMEEKSVTINGKTIKLPDPFVIIATQNPSDLSGTSLLPESQLDRFTISFSLNELSESDQIKILKANDYKKITKKNKIKKNNIFKNFEKVQINDVVIKYILKIEQHIKKNFDQIHISTRCLKFIVSASKSLSFLRGIDAVTFREIQDLLPYILRHRINMIPRKDVDLFIKEEILEKISLPE
jgi:MoxR-like ATPase